jgi:hypothetical protein
VYECEETCVFDIDIRAVPDGTLSNVSDVKISIEDPCGTILVDEASMTNESSGRYVYKYSFKTDCRYGEYKITYKAEEGTGITGIDITKKRNTLFLFRHDIMNKVRSYSGITNESVNNEDLARISMEALREALDEVYEFHKDVKPSCDPDTGLTFNGSNTEVRTPHKYLADHDFDGSVSGFDVAPCNGDITGYYIDSDYERQDINITVDNAEIGKITITDATGDPIPNNHNGVFISYWTEWESYNEDIFIDSVSYLAAHHLILRMTEAHRATAADLPSNQKKIELNLRRFYNKYRALMEKISRPLCDGFGI